MPDASYQPAVYRKQGGNELVVASGGSITYESGSARTEAVITATATAFSITAAQSGATWRITAPDTVVSLPATQAGLRYRFLLASAALSTGAGLKISPVAADAIHGNGLTSTDNEDAILAGSGDREGDMIALIGDGVDGYYIIEVEGTWSKG